MIFNKKFNLLLYIKSMVINQKPIILFFNLYYMLIISPYNYLILLEILLYNLIGI